MIRSVYLILAIVGAIWPMYHFLTYLTGEGASLSGMLGQWTTGPAVTGMAIDLMIAGVTLLFWIVVETVREKDPVRLIAIPGLMIGVSCGLPLFLFLRSRQSAAANRVP